MGLMSWRKIVPIMIVAAFSFGLLLRPYESSETPKMKAISAPLLGIEEAKNPEIAKQYGIVGYVEFNTTENTPKTLVIRRGEEANITILIHFVSYDPEVKEARLTINPANGRGLTIEKCYVIMDEKGNVTGRGTININKLISYNVTGSVRIPAGETLKVTLTIRIPKEFPSGVDPFPLGAVGIELQDVPQGGIDLIDNIEVMVYV